MAPEKSTKLFIEFFTISLQHLVARSSIKGNDKKAPIDPDPESFANFETLK